MELVRLVHQTRLFDPLQELKRGTGILNRFLNISPPPVQSLFKIVEGGWTFNLHIQPKTKPFYKYGGKGILLYTNFQKLK